MGQKGWRAVPELEGEGHRGKLSGYRPLLAQGIIKRYAEITGTGRNILFRHIWAGSELAATEGQRFGSQGHHYRYVPGNNGTGRWHRRQLHGGM